MKKLSQINENIFDGIGKRSKGNSVRKENIVTEDDVMQYLDRNKYNSNDELPKISIVNLGGKSIVNIEGNFIFRPSCEFTKFPFTFGKVTGEFDCSVYALETLEGCPEEVTGTFSCCWTKIKNLIGGPKKVGKDYLVWSNQLESLEGSPKNINGAFHCFRNNLKSLEGGPEYVGDNYNCSLNQLESLKGCPKLVKGDFNINDNKLEKLDYLPKTIEGSLTCHTNLVKFDNNEIRKICNVDGHIVA